MKKSIQLTFIRHAPTESNKSGVFMGSLDMPCDIQELEKHEARLRDLSINFDTIYSSPLSRAFVTAKFIFPTKNIVVDNRLTEKDMGEWRGKTKDEIKLLHPEAFFGSGHLNPLFVPENGETNESLVERVDSFLKDIVSTQISANGKYKIAIVTHNGVIRVVRHIVENLPVQDIFSVSEKFLYPINFRFSTEVWKKELNLK